MRRSLLPLLALLCAAATLTAEQLFPAPDWKDEVSPLASPDALPGGEISIFAGPEPESLNMYLSNWVTNSLLFSMMYETLLGSDPLTLEETPNVARRWSISDDKKTFTFWLDERARWSDGKPLTAHDVAWTFNTVRNSPHTGAFLVQFNRFDSVEVVDDYTIRFHAKDVHWNNLGVAGGFEILPKHYFEGKPFREQNRDFGVVSGAYRIGDYRPKGFIVLERRSNWWQQDRPSAQFVYNFERIRLRWFDDRNNAFEAFKDGKIDLFPVYTSSRWVKETQADPFRKNWIVKQKVFNYQATGFQGWPMNMRRFPFDDARVRKAMCHLVNRPQMNATIMYNQYKLHRSYYEDLWTPENPCPNELVDYSVQKARELLAEAGWAINPDTGKLEKDGRPFTFTFLARSPTEDKFLAIFREDLERVGIEMDIEQKDLSAWGRDMKSFSFDMTWAAFGGGGPKKDPEPMWYSEQADRPSSPNYTGFQNDRVDELIIRQRTNFDVEERHDMVREIDTIIYADYPYVLLWYIDAVRLLYWNKFGTPTHVLGKYGGEHSALAYWWVDPDWQLDLEDAMENDSPLPPRPPEVHFDDAFIAP